MPRKPPVINDLSAKWASQFNRNMSGFRKELIARFRDDADIAGKGPLSKHAYNYNLSPTKMEKLVAWVDRKVHQGVFRLERGAPRAVYKGNWWGTAMVESAYKRGMVRAMVEMKKAKVPGMANVQPGTAAGSTALDAAFLTPIHMDRVVFLYARTFEGMRGLAGTAGASLSNTLAEGMVSGRNPYDIAKDLEKTLDITEARSRTIARTEIMRAHHVGGIQTYREAGIEGVQVEAELITVAGGKAEVYEDLHVCPQCQALEKRTKETPLTLDEAEPLIPVHPNCRCTVIPVIRDVQGSPNEQDSGIDYGDDGE